MRANLPGAVRRPPDLTTERARAVLARVRAIPPGCVAAYSDVDPVAPRFVGTVLSAAHDPGLPWHRVVRADGTLSQGERQAALLAAEDVPLTGDPRRVDARLARWWSDVDPA
jgi:alkylated DNA nucleotide flippase Atl1